MRTPSEIAGARSSLGFARAPGSASACIWERPSVNWPPVPPVLAFMGLRNEDANGRPVPTSLIPLAAVLEQLKPEPIEILCRSDFLISAPDSNDDDQSIKAPVLVRDPVHGDHIRFDAGVTEGLSEPANVGRILDVGRPGIDFLWLAEKIIPR